MFSHDIYDGDIQSTPFRGCTYTDCTDLKQTGARLYSPIRDEVSDRGRDEILENIVLYSSSLTRSYRYNTEILCTAYQF